MNGIDCAERHQMHQLTSLQSYFYACDVPSEQIKLSFFPAKNPVDVRREVVQSREAKKNLVGSKELICAVTKSLNLFATSMFSALPRQKFLGSNVLCIPLVHASRPIDKKVWALSLVKVTLCDGLHHSIGQVTELWSALMSKPHEKHTF
jgi:hypothetical protein